MQESWQQVLDEARNHLHDTQPAGGAVWTNTALQLHAAKAYRKMYDVLGGFGGNRVRREFYINLPAYTQLLVPQAVGLTDMAEPEMIMERGNGMVTVNIATTSAPTIGTGPVQVATSTPHNLTSNSTEFYISSVAGSTAPLGRWFGTVVDPVNVTLNGSISDGNAGAGGVLTVCNDKATEVVPIDAISDRDINNKLLDYLWEENVLKFRGASTQRQLRITYLASGQAPTIANTVIGIDNCLNFLGCYTAALAANANGWYTMADRLLGMCFGPKGEGDGSGGFLRDFTSIQVRLLQRKTRRPEPFRYRRGGSSSTWV